MSDRKRTHDGASRSGVKRPIGLQRLGQEGEFALVHPACVKARQEDLDEVHTMLAAGEEEIAEDELRWLLNGCNAFIEGHRLLGEIALRRSDFELARSHFGYAYELGLAALPPGQPCRLPYQVPANRAWLEAAKGLIDSLGGLGETQVADEVRRRVLEFDPTDPLHVGPG